MLGLTHPGVLGKGCHLTLGTKLELLIFSLQGLNGCSCLDKLTLQLTNLPLLLSHQGQEFFLLTLADPIRDGTAKSHT